MDLRFAQVGDVLDHALDPLDPSVRAANGFAADSDRDDSTGGRPDLASRSYGCATADAGGERGRNQRPGFGLVQGNAVANGEGRAAW